MMDVVAGMNVECLCLCVPVRQCMCVCARFLCPACVVCITSRAAPAAARRAQYFDIFQVVLGDPPKMCSLPMSIFGLFDHEKKGKASLNEVFTGLALLCAGDLRERVNLCFSLYDGVCGVRARRAGMTRLRARA